jgi:hypothetical protein
VDEKAMADSAKEEGELDGFSSMTPWRVGEKRGIRKVPELSNLYMPIYFQYFDFFVCRESRWPRNTRARMGARAQARLVQSQIGTMTRVNSTNVLDEGLRIGKRGRQMNSKVKSVKQGVYRK